MTHPPPDPGFCVCGRPLPEERLSDWACSEVCQSAWMQHNTNPDYPHPRDIREAAARRAAGTPPREHLPAARRVAEGTEIDVDGQLFVRVGTYWQPAGMWEVLRGGIADVATYRRWCPRCVARVDSLIYPADNRQECAQCGHQWPGRPLLGQIEQRGEPWPSLRMRLFDGQRSALFVFHEQALGAAPLAGVDAGRVALWWLRLERQLGGGYADADLADERLRQLREGRQQRTAQFCTDLT